MTAVLLVAAALLLLVGVAHSYLGERYILMRLFRRSDLPRLFGSDWFTRRTLRFAWHLTSVGWWGFGGALGALAAGTGPRLALLGSTAATFLVTAAVAAGASRGRHLAWPVFLAVGLLAAWAASG